MKKYLRRSLSWLLTLAMILSLFPVLGTTVFAANASNYPGATYTATARVDESIGLRAHATITGASGTVTGITPLDTKTTNTPVAPVTKTLPITNDNTLNISVTPYNRYTVDKVVVAAIARITHADNTIEAVRDIYTKNHGTAGQVDLHTLSLIFQAL